MPVFTAKVADGADDAHERVSNGAIIQQTVVNMAANTTTSGAFYAIFRLQLDVPRGAEISSAIPKLYLSLVNNDNPEGVWYFEASDNAGAITLTAGDISNRLRTSAGVPWSASDLVISSGWVDGPNLAGPLQEVIDRPGWSSGNYAALIWVPSTSVVKAMGCMAFEGNAENALELVVTFTESGGPDPQTINLSTIGLSFAVPDSSVNPGSVSVSLDTLTLGGMVSDIAIGMSGALVALSTLALGLGAVSFSVTPGPVMIGLQALALGLGAAYLSVVPGAVQAGLNTLRLLSRLPVIAVMTTGAQTIFLNSLSLALFVVDLVRGIGTGMMAGKYWLLLFKRRERKK